MIVSKVDEFFNFYSLTSGYQMNIIRKGTIK
jgi:hypothetical protein